jgi:hypothetical protein
VQINPPFLNRQAVEFAKQRCVGFRPLAVACRSCLFALAAERQRRRPGIGVSRRALSAVGTQPLSIVQDLIEPLDAIRTESVNDHAAVSGSNVPARLSPVGLVDASPIVRDLKLLALTERR